MTDKRLRNDPLNWIKKSEIETPPETPKIGRPRTIKRKYTKSSQEGLKDNWTRYTVIIREDLLERLKGNVYEQDKTMKLVINEMIEDYLNDRETSPETPKIGRPRTIKRKYTKSSQEGVKGDWKRYTIITREDLLERLKDNVYEQDKTMKLVINEMIEDYLNDREK